MCGECNWPLKMNESYNPTLKDKFLHSILNEFLEFCYENPEVDLDPSYFYNKENKIIWDFLEERQRKYLED